MTDGLTIDIERLKFGRYLIHVQWPADRFGARHGILTWRFGRKRAQREARRIAEERA